VRPPGNDPPLKGRALGFDGKTLIHPAQIGSTNAAFAPGADEIAPARGVVPVDGRLVENLHGENARRVLTLADAIEARAGAD
jgi:citrate lyase beta subunit